MALHKIENGIRVDLTPKEEEEIKAEWASNKIKLEARREEIRVKEFEKERVINKLLGSLTEEEAALIKPKLM